MLLQRVILPSQAVAGRRLIIHYVSRHIIFHDLIPTNKSKGKGILRHKRRAQRSCLNSCVAWAITLTERRSAGFAFSGTLMPFPSIIRNPTGGATVEHLDGARRPKSGPPDHPAPYAPIRAACLSYETRVAATACGPACHRL